MRVFLQRLLAASQWGASLLALSGCESLIVGPSPVDQLPPPLEPAPEPACEGPDYPGPGYYGQCCQELLCQAPVDGVCPDAIEATPPGLPPGSGECECGTREGPFANPNPDAGATCCYLVGSIGCDGRPLVVGGELRLAPTTRSRAWGDAATCAVEGLSPEARARLAEGWTRRARFEHASIASFARFSLSLLALGAPPELVRLAHAAAEDEVAHARACFSLAARLAGEPVGPGRLDVGGAFERLDDLEAALVGAILEGCVGETLAALEAAEAAHQATDPGVRDALIAIAEDETRHAELAWAFARWALGQDARLGAVARDTFDAALRAAREPEREEELPAGLGFLSHEDRRSLRARALEQVLAPAADALTRGRSAGRARRVVERSMEPSGEVVRHPPG